MFGYGMGGACGSMIAPDGTLSLGSVADAVKRNLQQQAQSINHRSKTLARRARKAAKTDKEGKAEPGAWAAPACSTCRKRSASTRLHCNKGRPS